MYFGKGCEFFVGQWEQGYNGKICEPVLCYCNHKNNLDEYKGNCSKELCPLGEDNE